MLLPIDTIVALLVLMVEVESPHRETLPFLTSLSWVIAGALLVGLFSWIAGQTAVGLIQRQPTGGCRQRSISGFVDVLVRSLCVLVFVGILRLSAWPLSASLFLGFDAQNRIAQGLLGLLPYLLLCLASWTPLYALHVKTSIGAWSRQQYLLHKARYNLFILGVGIPSIIVSGLIEQPAAGAEAPTFGLWYVLANVVFLGLAIWLFPLFLRFFWGCRPLPRGRLRDRVLALQERAGVRFSEVYIWELGGGNILNAAAVGVFRPCRYLFLSQAVITNMTEEELDGVVCHEMGHVRHWHLIFYVASTTAAVLGIQTLLAGIPYLYSNEEGLLLFACSLILYIRFGFGFISRRFERQADLYALEVLGSARPLCDALEKIALLSGNIRNAYSWHHMSIAERVEFLQRAQASPRLARIHHGALRALKGVGYYAVALLFTYHLMHLLDQQPPPPQETRSPAEAATAHYQRLRRFLPQDPTGPLGLASHHLAAKEPDLARSYAQEALDKAHTDRDRRRAKALLERATPLARPPADP